MPLMKAFSVTVGLIFKPVDLLFRGIQHILAPKTHKATHPGN